MNDLISKNLVQCLNENSGSNFQPKFWDSRPSNSISFTIKNYKSQDGLSKQIHQPCVPNQNFKVKGPLGTGLIVQPTGEYIVFAAGTGILCYIDLVA
jgi:NAD(P)H-flavin reductase